MLRARKNLAQQRGRGEECLGKLEKENQNKRDQENLTKLDGMTTTRRIEK